MITSRHDRKRKALPQGFALAFLAVAIQLLLPFLVAFEIAAASTPAYAETTTICLAAGSTALAAHPGGETTHHGLAEGCPICIALAAGQAFITPAPIAAPLPRVFRRVFFVSQLVSATTPLINASYNPRAPPSIA